MIFLGTVDSLCPLSYSLLLTLCISYFGGEFWIVDITLVCTEGDRIFGLYFEPLSFGSRTGYRSPVASPLSCLAVCVRLSAECSKLFSCEFPSPGSPSPGTTWHMPTLRAAIFPLHHLVTSHHHTPPALPCPTPSWGKKLHSLLLTTRR